MFRKKKQQDRLNTDGTMKWKKKTSTNVKKESMRESIANLKSTFISEDPADILGACELPADMDCNTEDDLNSWLAENTVEFFNDAYLNYSMATNNNSDWDTICKRPKGQGNNGYPEGMKFLWKPSENSKPVELPADEYISHLFIWIEQKIEDESIFPPDEDTPFPRSFKKYLKKICDRILRVYIIIHANDCLKDNIDKKQLNATMTFFLYFAWHWEILNVAGEKEAKSMANMLEPFRSRYAKDMEKRAARIQNRNTSRFEELSTQR